MGMEECWVFLREAWCNSRPLRAEPAEWVCENGTQRIMLGEERCVYDGVCVRWRVCTMECGYGGVWKLERNITEYDIHIDSYRF